MERCGTTKLSVKKGDFELHLERSNGNSSCPTGEREFDYESEAPRFTGKNRGVNAPLPRSDDMSSALLQTEDKKSEAPGIFITSPMVGTFYASPSPDEPHFVKVGDRVEKGAVVCIIEAMKVMNEIKAQVSGTVVEILADNGHPVEFGSKLFRINSN